MNAPCPKFAVKLIHTRESGTVFKVTLNDEVRLPFSERGIVSEEGKSMHPADEGSSMQTPGCGMGVGTRLGAMVGDGVGTCDGFEKGTIVGCPLGV